MNSTQLVGRLLLLRPALECLGVVSIVIGGSVGRGTNDAQSDIDVFVVAATDELPELRERFLEVVSLIERPLLFRAGPFVPNYGYSYTCMFEDFTVVQFNLNSAGTLVPSPLGSHKYIEVFDSGVYAKYRAASE